MKNTFKYYELMKMIKDTCRVDYSRQLETYLRKETILSFIHVRPENRTLQGADEQWPLSISLQETAAAYSPRSFISEEKETLDVGCGQALLSVYLAKHQHKVTAIDSNSSQLKFALEMINRYGVDVTLKLCDAQNLDFPSESFDLVIWEEVLEHLKEPLLALKEGCRVLRPEGKIILSVPNLNSLRSRMFKLLGFKNRLLMYDHKQYFNQGAISELVNEANFRIISQTSDFIPVPKLPLSLFLDKRKALAKRYPSLGHHLVVYAQKK